MQLFDCQVTADSACRIAGKKREEPSDALEIGLVGGACARVPVFRERSRGRRNGWEYTCH
jgi:hypothetical protein